jgi:hypothetical protein
MGRFEHGEIWTWGDLNMGRFEHGEFWMGRFEHGEIRKRGHLTWGVLNMQVILPG